MGLNTKQVLLYLMEKMLPAHSGNRWNKQKAWKIKGLTTGSDESGLCLLWWMNEWIDYPSQSSLDNMCQFCFRGVCVLFAQYGMEYFHQTKVKRRLYKKIQYVVPK